MKKTNAKFLPVLAIVLGIIALVVGIHSNATKDLYDMTVTATIVDVQEEWENTGDPDTGDRLVHTSYIDYEVDGKKYENVLSPVQNEDAKVGDTVEILCQSKNPEKISAPDIAKTSVIFIIVGALVTLGGLIGGVFMFLRRR